MELVNKLFQNQSFPLAGHSAHLEMAPIGRNVHFDSSIEFKKASVLSLIYPDKNKLNMVFIRRTSHDKDLHSNQISFPGGRVEKNDKNIIETALREANEEINVKASSVQVIRKMTPLQIPVSKYEVHPVLAISRVKPHFKAQISEVDEILEIPLEQILNPNYKEKQPIQLSNGARLKNVPVFNFSGEIIWGATAMMLNEIVHLIQQIR